ncbi:unnamed protein product [Urochloa humidicola]
MSLTAWTDRPCRIPKEATVFIAEHELPVVHSDPDMQRIFTNVRPYLREKAVLQYETIIHLRSFADFRSRSPSPRPGPSPPSSDGDSGHDGNPDRGFGSSGDGGPRLQGFICHPGVPDGQPPQTGGGGDGGGASTSRRAPQPPTDERVQLHREDERAEATPSLEAMRPATEDERPVPSNAAAPVTAPAPEKMQSTDAIPGPTSGMPADLR